MIVAEAAYRRTARSIDVAPTFAIRDVDALSGYGPWQICPDGAVEDSGHCIVSAVHLVGGQIRALAIRLRVFTGNCNNRFMG
jgi:hypothetical protein